LPFHQRPDKFQEVKAAFLGCLLNTTGYGLPKIVKPGNPLLNVLWVIFYAVAVSLCGSFVYYAFDQYYRYDVITMTKINRETEMTLPVITICSQYENTYDMIIECRGPSGIKSKINKLELYDRFNHHEYCVQLSYGTNVTELLPEKMSQSYYLKNVWMWFCQSATKSVPLSASKSAFNRKELMSSWMWTTMLFIIISQLYQKNSTFLITVMMSSKKELRVCLFISINLRPPRSASRRAFPLPVWLQMWVVS